MGLVQGQDFKDAHNLGNRIFLFREGAALNVKLFRRRSMHHSTQHIQQGPPVWKSPRVTDNGVTQMDGQQCAAIIQHKPAGDAIHRHHHAHDPALV